MEAEREALWYYLLREAEFAPQVQGSTLTVGGAGDRLGTLGSIIVAATFAGLLKGDPLSFVNLDYRGRACFCLEGWISRS
ncbi:hypothetical protein [Neorhizobium galegae]|uniref:hypothetical protein n=1 Tax=Neorhizobium galegae TaxID=399 RepID=UPI0021067CD3|nr:hypothetical protein [Neorhizobium galegae]MCQ1850183.1 hypothetical protein [Neorhizobium galegae]